MLNKTIKQLTESIKNTDAKSAMIAAEIIRSIKAKNPDKILLKDEAFLYKNFDFYQDESQKNIDAITEDVKTNFSSWPAGKILIALNIIKSVKSGSKIDWKKYERIGREYQHVGADDFLVRDIDFITGMVNGLTERRDYILPSDYIEEVRYLPLSLTPIPGYYDFGVAPWIRELLDNAHPASPIHEWAFMKAAQICATVGVIENMMLYYMGCVPRNQVFMSGDEALVKESMETYLEAAIDSCDLRKIIGSQNKSKSQRTGDTTMRKEYPGGVLKGIGAKSATKLRRLSAPVVTIDELDSCPKDINNEGPPHKIIRNRTNAFAKTRKLFYTSTPTILQTSHIYQLYLQGDQRHLYIQCPRCSRYIVLYWHVEKAKAKCGKKSGIVYELDSDFNPIPASIRYRCQECGGAIKHEEKAIFLPTCEWRPTAKSKKVDFRSYWMNSLYSPLGMYSWEKIVEDFCDAWDHRKDKVKDIAEYKIFRNTKQGLPFEERGEAPRYERVIAHRRKYPKNEIINEMAVKETGGPVLLLTCGCDVHKDDIHVHIIGWTASGRSHTIDMRVLEGNTEHSFKGPWLELSDIVENGIWTSDDDKQYRIRATFVDAGYRADAVYDFCGQYASGVYPIFGRDWIPDGVTYKEASKVTIEKAGTMCYHINTSKLKDRIASSFRVDWNTGEMQPNWYPNYPEDIRDDIFRHYEAEYKAEKYDNKTNKFLGIFWVQIPGKDNHFFDTHVYGMAALELIAEQFCLNELGLISLDWGDFWLYVGDRYYTQVDPAARVEKIKKEKKRKNER